MWIVRLASVGPHVCGSGVAATLHKKIVFRNAFGLLGFGIKVEFR